MEKVTLDIEATITFEKYDEIPVDQAIMAITCINEAFFASELEDLRALRYEFADIPSVAYDAAEHRLLQYKKRSVLLMGINKGSVEIGLIGAGLALWFIKQTIGETIKEAWRETDLHKRIRQFLTSRIHEKRQAIVEDSKRLLEKRLAASVSVKLIDTTERAQIKVQIWISPKNKEPFSRSHEQTQK
jgi:hypothetical protein